jgi:hypothetical protein
VRSRRNGNRRPTWQNRNTLPIDTRARRSHPRIDEEPLHGSRQPRGRQIVVRVQTATIGEIRGRIADTDRRDPAVGSQRQLHKGRRVLRLKETRRFHSLCSQVLKHPDCLAKRRVRC